jgi:hypothetical protein
MPDKLTFSVAEFLDIYIYIYIFFFCEECKIKQGHVVGNP